MEQPTPSTERPTHADRIERTRGALSVAFDLFDATVSIVADTHRRERARWRGVLDGTPAAPVARPAAAVHAVATEPTFATLRAVSVGLRGLSHLALRAAPVREKLAGPPAPGKGEERR